MGDLHPFFIMKKADGSAALQEAAAEGDVLKTIQMAVLPAKDSSGNEAKIPLTSDGRIPVDDEEPGDPVSDYGTATPSALDTDTDIATVTLTVDKNYRDLSFVLSSRFPCEFRVVQVDDTSETDLLVVNTGSGNLSYCCNPKHLEFDAGSSGTQELKVVAKQLQGPLSAVHAYIDALES